MPVFDWDAELSEADRDALIEKCARLVVARGMSVPAVLFLDMHRPLGFLAGQSLILASGFLAPLVGPQRVQQLSKLLQSPSDVDLLIARIETLNLTPTDPTRSEQAESGQRG